MFSASLRSMFKRFPLLAVFLAGIAFSQAKAPASFLPQTFSGWQIEKPSIKTGADPAAVDPADFPVLKEYGFAESEGATYRRNGRKIQIKAVRFNDASGAFGAFTYYVQPQMRTEKIGDKGASNNTRILFFKGNILVDASLEHLTAMSGADLRALADALPRPQGEASMIIVGYPTPQIAREQLTIMQSASLPGGPFYFKRSGPFVVAIGGSIPADEAQSLLASVNYDADVTWNQPTKLKPTEDRAGFIVALVLLCIIAVLGALIFGFMFGGLRLLAARLFPKVFNHPKAVEFIRLNLK